MLIYINNEPKEFSKAIMLSELVLSSLDNTLGLAVAVNNTVIPKAEWKACKLEHNDKIIFIRATQGG